MAAAAEGAVKGLSEETTCPLCLDYFADPVVIDCGHNFCQACLTQCWGASDGEVSCPQCRVIIQPRTFKPNRQLANVAGLVKKLQEGQKRDEAGDGKAKGVCKIHQEPLKLFCREDEAPICVVCDKSKEHRGHDSFPVEEAFQEYKEKNKIHLESLRGKREELKNQKYFQELRMKDYQTQLDLEKMKMKSLFETVQRFLEEKQHFCFAQLEDLEKEMEKRQEKTLTKLSEEISRLTLLIKEMEEKCLQPASEFLQDIRNSLTRCENNLVGYVVDVSPDLETRLRMTSQKTSALQKATEFYKEGLEQALITDIWEQTFQTDSSRQAPNRVNVTLDPETAHPKLLLSQNLKNVRMFPRAQQLPNNPERFDWEPFVLGRERFTSGRHCWEVEVYSDDTYAVGISSGSVRKKGRVQYPAEGIWAIQHKKGEFENSEISVFTLSGEISFCLGSLLSRIFVALDYEEGCVEFFDANSKEFIFAYHSVSFSGEEIRPFFHVPCTGTLQC